MTTLIYFCHWKTLVPFSLRKERPENAFLTLIIANRTRKQIMSFKTTVNWVFNI